MGLGGVGLEGERGFVTFSATLLFVYAKTTVLIY